MANVKDFGELRLIDLVAKLSRNKLREVEGTLIALELVLEEFGVCIEQVLRDIPEEDKVPLPSPSNVAACSHAFNELFSSDCS